MSHYLRLWGIAVAIMALVGCDNFTSSPTKAGEIPFTLTGIEKGACPALIKIGESKWQIDYFGFYLTNPEVRIDGRWQPVKFKQNHWQTQTTALLQFHSLCSSPKDANSKISLDVSEEFMKLATNLRFTMGLPFDVNHADPLTQSAPLNVDAMVKNQQEGHRFLRLDLSQVGEGEKSWSYHLGSAGCVSDAIDSAPTKSCAFTNRVEFILPMTQLDSELALEISVSNILSKVQLTDQQNCMFTSPEAQPCKQLLNNLLHRPWIKWD